MQTENAAPSEHLFFEFPSDAVAKIHKIKITQSANATYFSVHNFRGGYNGLQQTPDKNYGTPYILLASLWDPNTAARVFSRVSYAGANTITGRFGGEGDGSKTVNPYKWTLNTWYNIAIRSWKNNGELYIATFIQNMDNGIWFHTSTLAQPDRAGFLGAGNDAFLENWIGYNSSQDGRSVRKAFFKDCWNLNSDNIWQKHTKRTFSANDNDKVRNGKYDRSFNSGYDSTEDAYFMQHGGDTEPDKAFGTGRKLNLPEQTHQGSAPKLSKCAISSLTVDQQGRAIYINWTTDNTANPQLSSKIELIDARGNIVETVQDVLPEKRSATTKAASPGKYTVRVTITDIFNQISKAIQKEFVII